MKVWIRCDRNDEWKDKDHDHKIIFLKRIECSFKCIAKLQFNLKNENELNDWIFIVVRLEHNHSSVQFFNIIIYWKVIMKQFKVLEEIKKNSANKARWKIF